MMVQAASGSLNHRRIFTTHAFTNGQMSVAIRSDQGTSESESLYSALQVSMEPSMVLNRNFVSSPRRKASLATPRSTNVAKRCSAGVIT